MHKKWRRMLLKKQLDLKNEKVLQIQKDDTLLPQTQKSIPVRKLVKKKRAVNI